MSSELVVKFFKIKNFTTYPECQHNSTRNHLLFCTQNNWVSNFFPIRISFHLPVQPRSLSSFRMCIVWPHCIHFDICTIGGNELFVKIAALFSHCTHGRIPTTPVVDLNSCLKIKINGNSLRRLIIPSPKSINKIRIGKLGANYSDRYSKLLLGKKRKREGETES